MKKTKMLASITADTSRIESKITGLLEMFPEHIPDEILGIFSRLTNEVILVNGSVTVATDGSFNVVYAMDFDTTAYDEVMSAARAFKFNLAHE